MDLSIILLTWNSGRYIKDCLLSLSRDLENTGIHHEILIIDNGSHDNTRDMIMEAGLETVSLIELGHNTGTTFSRNIGLRAARGKYICIMDSDMEVAEADTFSRLLQHMESHPEIGILAPRLNFRSGNLQKSTDIFPTLTHKIKRFLMLRKMEEQEQKEASEEIREVDYAISAFWLFRKELTDDIGLLDEQIFYAPEDVDFCIRCWLSGKSIVYIPAVSVIHDAQEISRRNILSKHTLNHVLGLIYYFRKHGYLFSLKHVRQRIAAAHH